MSPKSGSRGDGDRRAAESSGAARRTNRSTRRQRDPGRRGDRGQRGDAGRRGGSARSGGADRAATAGRGASRGGEQQTAGQQRVRAGARAPVSGVRRWWRWGLVGVLALATVLAVVLLFTPVVGVRQVKVSGLRVLSERRVERAAAVSTGTPMLRVDTDAIRERVTRLPRVDTARVLLSWPSTVRVEVSERTAVAVDVVSDGFRLVDDEGVAFATVPERPKGMPELRVSGEAGDGARRSAVTVLGALPELVLGQVRVVEVERGDNVRLRLTRGRTVEWGSTRLSERKAAVLPPLLTRHGEVYDVTSPALPTVS